ncbi:MAG: hypothetical protein LBV16_02355 [Elusimicrobiota bacterium]|jgi:hypothetical protein|nr:hypothetical protein [Elusimicrobiota bacterium]
MSQMIFAKKKKKDAHVKISSGIDNPLDIFPDLNFENPKKFSPKWQIAEGEIFFIDLSDEEDRSLLKPYFESIDSSANLNIISKSDLPNISVIYTAITIKSVRNIKFQKIWNKYYFKRGFMQFNDVECEIHNNDSLVILTGKTDAFWNGEENRLYFANFRDIKHMFDGIDKFYREATKKDVEKFSAISLLYVNQKADFGQRALKKIAIMIDDDIFNGKTLEMLKSYAVKYGQILPEIENEKIKICNNEQVEILYKLVNGMFYTSEINNEKREINSFARI